MRSRGEGNKVIHKSIDVLMPIYNAERHLEVAVRSILQQTMTDFQIICVNDGSTDGSADILARLSGEDERVKIISQQNKGLVGALNRGLAACTAPFVARMDADDIAMPDRFEKQLAFLIDNPKILAVGSSVLEIDRDDEPLGVEHFGIQHQEIEDGMMRMKTALAHPAAMIRREVFNRLGGYRPEFEFVEDLDLWFRISEIGELANLPDVLLCYRQHASVSWQLGRIRRRRILELLTQAYQRRGRSVPQYLIKRCEATRSPAGPHKWARKASRNGQWRVANKHLRQLWVASPVSLLTWRMTLETLFFSATSQIAKPSQILPRVPAIKRVA